MADKINDKILRQLQSLYGFGFSKSAPELTDKVYPTQKDPKNPDKFKKEDWPDNVVEAYKLFWSNTWTSEKLWKNLSDLYDDMDELYHNEPIIARAERIIANEVVQAGSGFKCIGVEANKKQRDHILGFFDRTNTYGLLFDLALHIVHNGNGYLVPSVSNGQIESLELLDPRDIKERIEFSAHDVVEQEQNKKSGRNSFLTKYRQIDRVDYLIKSIEDKQNEASYYKKYLLGFQVGSRVLPPWKLFHFRNNLAMSPFKPFGCPLYVHALAPYSQLHLGMSLQAAARSANLPKEIWTLNPGEGTSVSQKLEKAIQLMNNILNQGFGKSKKEDVGIGETIFMFS